MAASFVAAMDAMAVAGSTTTENGARSLTATEMGNARVALFFKMVRGMSGAQMDELLGTVMREANAQNNVEMLVDCFLIAFQARDVRGGKGERDLFHMMLERLYSAYPATVLATLQLVPLYGSFNDVTKIARDCKTENVELRDAAVTLFANQLTKDAAPALKTPSLAGKWAPREKRKDKVVAKLIAKKMYASNEMQQYRKTIAMLNKRLKTVEVDMSGNTWNKIVPAKVPALCLKKNGNAFRALDKFGNAAEALKNNPVRQACANTFKEHLEACLKDGSTAKVHGAVLHPHELVSRCLGSAKADSVIEAQWLDITRKLREDAGAMKNLGKMIPIVDVSGSMGGTPMEVAIALGLIVAEFTHPSFRNRFITFDSTPTWHMIPKTAKTLFEKVRNARGAEWGGSTDFQASMMLVLEACLKANMSRKEVAELSLVVFSDMQFNQSDRNWTTNYGRIKSKFANKGYPDLPTIVFWNLRAGTRDFPATADTPGVCLISGFSPSLLKAFFEEDLEQVAAKPEDMADAYDKLRVLLDDARYDPVRAKLAEVGEGMFANYEAPSIMEVEKMTVGSDDWEVV